MQKKTKIIGIAVSSILALGIVSTGIYWAHAQKFNYDQLTQTNEPITVFNQVTKNKPIHYEYYYKPECKDCQKAAQDGIIPKLKHLQAKGELTVINVDKFNHNSSKLAQSWFASNYIQHTPTLLIRSHGYNLYTYTGTDQNHLNALLKGINPETKKPFDLKHRPTVNTYQNDFNHETIYTNSFKANTIGSIN